MKTKDEKLLNSCAKANKFKRWEELKIPFVSLFIEKIWKECIKEKKQIFIYDEKKAILMSVLYCIYPPPFLSISLSRYPTYSISFLIIFKRNKKLLWLMTWSMGGWISRNLFAVFDVRVSSTAEIELSHLRHLPCDHFTTTQRSMWNDKKSSI